MLLKLSLGISLLGICLLYLLSFYLTEHLPVSAKDGTKSTAILKIHGVVDRISETDTVAFITLNTTNQETIVVFKEDAIPLPLQHGAVVEILGKEDEFKGKEEIIAYRIKTLG